MTENASVLSVLVVGNFHKARSSEAFAAKLTAILSSFCRVQFLDYRKLGILRVPELTNALASHRSPLMRGLRYGLIQLMVARQVLLGRDTRLLLVLQALMCLPVLAGRVAGIPCIVMTVQRRYQHDGRGGNLKAAIIALVERTSLSLANRVLVESPSIAKTAPARFYQDKIVIGGVYVDTPADLRPEPPSKRPKTFAYVGQLSEDKGFDKFAAAMVEVLGRLPHAHALIVGEGILGPIASKLAAADNRVKYIPGVDHTAVFRLLSGARLLVVPSLSEGLPNVVLESMSMMTPVLATKAGGIADIVVEGETGFLLESSSAECIANRIVETIEREDLDQIAAEAYEDVWSRYSLGAAVARYAEIMTEVIGDAIERGQSPN